MEGPPNPTQRVTDSIDGSSDLDDPVRDVTGWFTHPAQTVIVS
jgi:hypothetical protein